MTRHYVTTAAAAHLPQLRVLVASMRQHCAPFRLHVLAEGPEVNSWAAAQSDLTATDVGPFLERHPDLAPDRLPGPPRNGNERACCWRWTFLCDVMEATSAPVLAVDADLMFWGSPEPVFGEIGRAPAAVLPHGFAPAAAGLPGVTRETHLRYGEFNGGFVYFAHAAAAAAMADLARACSHADTHVWPGGRVTWGDQGALSIVREAFPETHVIENPAAAPGPWRIHTEPLRRAHDGAVFFGGRQLVAFHYHAFQPLPAGGYRFSHASYEVTPEQERTLGDPYSAALSAAERE